MAVQMISLEAVVRYCPCIQTVLESFQGRGKIVTIEYFGEYWMLTSEYIG